MEFLLNRSIMLVLLLAFVMWACQVSSRVLNEEAMLQKHQQWMVHHGRAYRDNKEQVLRFNIFKDNVAYIEDFNSEHSAYKLSVNKFADQTKEEFIATHTGFRIPSTLRSAQNMKFRYDSVTGIPSSMDWRQKGAVTPVKAQGQCGKSIVNSKINTLLVLLTYSLQLLLNFFIDRKLLGVFDNCCYRRDYSNREWETKFAVSARVDGL